MTMNLRRIGKLFFRTGLTSVFILTVFFILYPIKISIVRLFLAISIPVILAGTAIGLWPNKFLRNSYLALLAVLLVCIILPGRNPVPQRLQNGYILSLKSYERTRYVWGGENRFGIDCSGLVRKGLIRANMIEGFRTLNPRLIRMAIEMWWYDSSARALKENYRNWTRLIQTSPGINELSLDSISPGDFAVTSDGIHALVYLGHGEWIEADPAVGKVIRIQVPSQNHWFAVPVHILRWKQLETP